MTTILLLTLALASSDPDPDALTQQAVTAFEDGELQASVELFKQAYKADPAPNVLFNIGRVYEEMGELSEAIAYYEKFLAEPGVDIESRQAGTKRLEILRASAAEPLPPPPPPADSRPPPPHVVKAADGARKPSDRVPKRREQPLRVAGYSLMGVGGASLVVGAVFGGLAVGSKRDADKAEFVDDASDLRRQGKTRAAVADAMLATGGVLAGAGLVMVLVTLGKKNKRGTSRTAWAPLVGDRRVGVGLSRRF